MTSSKLVTAVTFLYLFGTVLYFNYLAFRSRRIGNLAFLATGAALALHTAAIIARWIESYRLGFGHAPLSNMYESLVFFSWCIALLYVLWELKLKSRILGAFAMPFAFLAIAYAALMVFGLIPGLNTLFGLVPLYGHDVWLHAVLAAVAAYFGFFSRPAEDRPATATGRL